MKKLFIITLVVVIVINFTYAQVVDFGVGITPDAFIGEKEEKKVEKPKDPFSEKLSERFKLDKDELQKLIWRGYGYTELIKLVLISHKSKKPLLDLVKLRDDGIKLSKISQDNKINYSTLTAEASFTKAEIMTELAKKSANSIAVSTSTLKSLTTIQLDTDTTIQIGVSGDKK